MKAAPPRTGTGIIDEFQLRPWVYQQLERGRSQAQVAAAIRRKTKRRYTEEALRTWLKRNPPPAKEAPAPAAPVAAPVLGAPNEQLREVIAELIRIGRSGAGANQVRALERAGELSVALDAIELKRGRQP